MLFLLVYVTFVDARYSRSYLRFSILPLCQNRPWGKQNISKEPKVGLKRSIRGSKEHIRRTDGYDHDFILLVPGSNKEAENWNFLDFPGWISQQKILSHKISTSDSLGHNMSLFWMYWQLSMVRHWSLNMGLCCKKALFEGLVGRYWSFPDLIGHKCRKLFDTFCESRPGPNDPLMHCIDDFIGQKAAKIGIFLLFYCIVMSKLNARNVRLK